MLLKTFPYYDLLVVERGKGGRGGGEGRREEGGGREGQVRGSEAREGE